MAETKVLEGRCFCGAVDFTMTVPAADFPIQSHICHCSLCRWFSGSPAIFHTLFNEGYVPHFKFVSSAKEDSYVKQDLESSMAVYVRPAYETLFCSTCGCHVGCRAPDGVVPRRWCLSTSIMPDQSSVPIFRHIYVNSAKGGGLSTIMSRQIGDREMALWEPPTDNPGVALVECEPVYGDDGQERLRAQCHCGGVSLTIDRPQDEHRADEDVRKKCISPKDPTKWHASLDLCDDCRLVTGTHVQAWTMLPLSAISPPIGPDLKLGTLKTIRTSASVLRAFCGVCGATALYLKEDAAAGPAGKPPKMVSVTVGMFRAPEGPLAERWLDWETEKVMHEQDGRKFNAEFTDSLLRGLKEWGQRKTVEA